MRTIIHFEGFVHNQPCSLWLRCYTSACGQNMATALQALYAECYVFWSVEAASSIKLLRSIDIQPWAWKKCNCLTENGLYLLLTNVQPKLSLFHVSTPEHQSTLKSLHGENKIVAIWAGFPNKTKTKKDQSHPPPHFLKSFFPKVNDCTLL